MQLAVYTVFVNVQKKKEVGKPKEQCVLLYLQSSYSLKYTLAIRMQRPRSSYNSAYASDLSA